MSLTSYRAAPPRAIGKRRPSQSEARRSPQKIHQRGISALSRPGNGLLSQVLRHIVPLVLKRLTAEFGMGSGLVTPQKSPGRRKAETKQAGVISSPLQRKRDGHD